MVGTDTSTPLRDVLGSRTFLRSLRTEAVVDPAARGRAFTLVFASQSLGFAAAGILLAALGPHGAIIVGSAAVFVTTLFVVTTDRPADRPSG